MKTIYYVLFMILVLILILGIYINSKIGSVKDYAAIANARSSVVLYTLDQNKIDATKNILMMDLVQLISEYDKDVYEKSRIVKSTLCKDIPKYHMKKIENYFQNDVYKSGKELEYKINIFKNIERISMELCLE